MKKSLIALAALAAAGAVSAQSSVTMYGLIDAGVAKTNTGAVGSATKNDGVATSARVGQTTVQQGNSSRLGFRGVEDLGGGLKAVFNFEHRFTPDDGAANPVFWAARSIVGVEGGFGRVTLGRDYVPAFWVALAGDPTGWNYVSQASGSYTFANYTSNDNSSIRRSNMVQYHTPNLGGFTAQLQVGAGEGAAIAAGAANALLNTPATPAAVRGRAIGFNAQYAAGPLYVGLGYDTYKVSAGTTPKLTIVGASYDLGFAKPSLTYSKANSMAATNNNTKNITAAATIPLGTSKAIVSYSKATVDGANNDYTKLGLGYYYSLSKRTTLYGNVGSTKLQSSDRSNAFDLGVVHTF